MNILAEDFHELCVQPFIKARISIFVSQCRTLTRADRLASWCFFLLWTTVCSFLSQGMSWRYDCMQGVTCLGFTDLPSRLPTQSSTLYSNNISKFLLSMGSFTTKVKDSFQIDPKDGAVRGALILENGELKWPAPAPPVHSLPFLTYVMQLETWNIWKLFLKGKLCKESLRGRAFNYTKVAYVWLHCSKLWLGFG